MVARISNGHRSKTLRHGANSDDKAVSIDIGVALDLLAAAVAERGPDFVYPPVDEPDQVCVHDVRNGPPSLVRHALSLAHVKPETLGRLVNERLRVLFVAGRLPVPLTLGAVVVLDAAERAQDCGRPWGEALTDARKAAGRLLDVLPDRAFDRGRTRPPAATGRTFRVRH